MQMGFFRSDPYPSRVSIGKRRLTQTAKHFHAQGCKDEEEEEEQEAEVADLGQSLHHGVQQRPNSLGHLQQF